MPEVKSAVSKAALATITGPANRLRSRLSYMRRQGDTIFPGGLFYMPEVRTSRPPPPAFADEVHESATDFGALLWPMAIVMSWHDGLLLVLALSVFQHFSVHILSPVVYHLGDVGKVFSRAPHIVASLTAIDFKLALDRGIGHFKRITGITAWTGWYRH